MRKTRVWITVGCCLFAATLFAATQFASAQSSRKPGLWEVTSTMSMAGMQMPQMPQLPPGVQMPPGAGGSPFGAHTTQICVTQAMIDKYGGPTATPPSHNSDCKMTDISIKPNGMTATMVCTGQLNATGDVVTTFTDAGTTSTTIHLKGTMQRGPNSMPIDMSMQASSVYKGPDCGSVKPIEMPTK